MSNNTKLAYHALRERIVSGDLAPGTRLVELAVANSLGFSRTPIREALKQLASEGLVSRDAWGRVIVHHPDNAEIEEVFEVREAIDGLAARLAAYRITNSELGRMRVIHDSLAEAIDSGDRDQALLANDLFHDAIYRAAGNRLLGRVGRELRDFIRRFDTLREASQAGVENVVADHELIIAALERREPDAAELATKGHLTAARDRFVRLEHARFGADDRRRAVQSGGLLSTADFAAALRGGPTDSNSWVALAPRLQDERMLESGHRVDPVQADR